MSLYLQLEAKWSPFFTKSEEETEEREIATKKRRLDFQEKKKQMQGRWKQTAVPRNMFGSDRGRKETHASVEHTAGEERMRLEAGENEPMRNPMVLGTCRHFGVGVCLRKRIIMMCNM